MKALSALTPALERLMRACRRVSDACSDCEASRSAALMIAADQGLRRAQQMRARVATWVLAGAGAGLSVDAMADGTGGSGAGASDFDALTTFLQSFVDFMTGPFGKGVVVISIIAAFCTWVFAPKDGIFGQVLRVAVAGIAIMNATVFVTNLGNANQGFSLK